MILDPQRKIIKRRQRYMKNRIAMAISIFLTGIVLLVLLNLMYIMIANSIPYLKMINVFSESYKPPFIGGGGLLHAIIGQGIITGLAIIIGVPLGFVIAIYTTLLAPKHKFAHVVSFCSDVLTGVPTIIIGLFIYSIFVLTFKHFSAVFGALSLAIIMLPITVRTTEEILKMTPKVLTESAYSLGLPKYMVIRDIILPNAKTSLLVGVILSISRVTGETAPLLFTALNAKSISFDINDSMASLPMTIYEYSNTADDIYMNLAWMGALILTVILLIINVVMKIIAARASNPQ